MTRAKRLFAYAYGVIKLTIAYLYVNIFRRDIYKKDIWLIAEKRTEARDNAYELFKYIRQHHPGTNAYFIISKNSSDLKKVEVWGNVVFNDSFKHFVYFVAAKFNIGSQPQGAGPSMFRNRGLRIANFFRSRNKYHINIKHGIIKDMHGMQKFDGCELISCATKREQEFLIKICGLAEERVPLLGLCRFDALHNTQDKILKQILIMPTFRSWLKPGNTAQMATITETKNFMMSEYFLSFSSLLASKRLKDLLARFGYKVVFYPHYSMQGYIHLFKKYSSENVVIADRDNYDVQDLLINSATLITDFSSVFFDFAYMYKPIIYFQFDGIKFRERHYAEGYFNYERDGFGPVTHTMNELLDALEHYLEFGAVPQEEYIQRSRDFFTLRDTRNCERVFGAISNLDLRLRND